MSGVVSGNYRELAPDEIPYVAQECQNAWMDPAIPRKQYESAVKDELNTYRNGGKCAPFDALIRCLRHTPMHHGTLPKPSLLDVGASGAYYSEVLTLAGLDFNYTACDFSQAFKDMAESLYPGIRYDVADARALPYKDKSFDVVLSGAVLMHCYEYRLAIQEAARVASRYVVFHRTPILLNTPTKYWVKSAYDVRTVEIWFNENELLELFKANRLTLVHSEGIFMDANFGYGHRSYLLAKGA